MKKGIDYTGIAVVCFCHDGNGKYLVGHRTEKCRDEHNTWEPVGSGGVDQGEKLEDTARREIMEEAGAKAQEIEFLGFREAFREHEGKQTHWVIFDYKVKVNPDEVKIMEPEKCDEFRWCTIEDVPEPMHSEFPKVLKAYKGKF